MNRRLSRFFRSFVFLGLAASLFTGMARSHGPNTLARFDRIPRLLIEAGYSRLAGVDIQALRKAMAKVDILPVEALGPDEPDRRSARWKYYDLSVLCEHCWPQGWWVEFPESRLRAFYGQQMIEAFFPHEALASIGVGDADYQVSAFLAAFALHPELRAFLLSSGLAPDAKGNSNALDQALALEHGGGGTQAGGGGEIFPFMVKMEAFADSARAFSAMPLSARANAERTLRAIRIELDSRVLRPSEKASWIRFSFAGGPDVIISRQAVESNPGNPGSRHALAQEAAAFLLRGLVNGR